jgi:glycerophosphoryl diester phosphodiesterase
LTALRHVDPSAMMGLIFEEPIQDYAKAGIELGVRQLCPNVALVSPEMVEQAHRLDLQVATWTVDDAAAMRAMIAAKVDGIMTNFPDRLQAILEDT